jgi:hypothetical protein
LDYKQTIVWQDAVKLALKLHTLSEDLPQDDQGSMGTVMRTLALQIPAEVAVDLVSAQAPKLDNALRLETQLHIVNQIYPAIDTQSVQKLLGQLLWRMADPKRFVEVSGGKEA